MGRVSDNVRSHELGRGYDVLSEVWPGASSRGNELLLAVRVSAYGGDEPPHTRRSARRDPGQQTLAWQGGAQWPLDPDGGACLLRHRAVLGVRRGRYERHDLRVSYL